MTSLTPLAVLSRFPGPLQPVGPLEPLGGGGGLSGSQLWRFSAAAGRLLLRAWPLEVQKLARVAEVHGWLLELSDLDYLPVPLSDREGRTTIREAARFWELTRWLPGEPERCCPPRRARVEAAIAALREVHERLAGHCQLAPSPGVGARKGELESLMEGGFDLLAAAIARAPAGWLKEAAAEWIRLARLEAPRLLPCLRDAAVLRVAIQPCLRDARAAHFLFTDDRLTGLIDFGSMGMESVAADLARLVGDWFPGNPQGRAAALEAYTRLRRLDASELAVLEAFEWSADLLIGSRWISWHFVQQRRFDQPGAVEEGLRRGLQRLARRHAGGGAWGA